MSARAETVERTRRQILDAAIGLFRERPFDLVSLAEVAQASQLSLATVVRQFSTKDQLFAAAVMEARQVLEGEGMRIPPNDPAAAVHSIVANYERFGDNIVRLLAQEDRVPAIREVTDHGREFHRSWTERAFAGTLSRLDGRARRVRFAQLVAATDVLFWKVLRRDLELSRREVESAMTEVVDALCH